MHPIDDPAPAPTRAKITITVIYNGQEVRLDTWKGEYRSLMMLLFDRLYPDDFGECKGMGRCGTCLVEITSSPSPLPVMDRNEQTTLSKMNVTDPSLRLSCQLLLDQSLHNCIITIL